MKRKPIFNVYVNDYNSTIRVVNFFDYGKWDTIKKELLKIKNAIKKVKFDDYVKICDKFLIRGIDCSKYAKKQDNFLYDAICSKLDSECKYYFWSKVEYEVCVCDIFDKKHEEKIDVYRQLVNNWDLFKGLVLKEIGL